jgi:hypothetical protein
VLQLLRLPVLLPVHPTQHPQSAAAQVQRLQMHAQLNAEDHRQLVQQHLLFPARAADAECWWLAHVQQ